MNLREALRSAIDGEIVEIKIDSRIKQIRATGHTFRQVQQREFNGEKWSDWHEFRPSSEQVESDEWEIWREEKEMGFTEALQELLDRDDDSIMYQTSAPKWLYKLGDGRPNRSILQKNSSPFYDWEEGLQIQIYKDMLTKKDWVIKSPNKKEEKPKDEKCDCPFHRMMRDM